MAKLLIEDLHPIKKTPLDVSFPFFCCLCGCFRKCFKNDEKEEKKDQLQSKLLS